MQGDAGQGFFIPIENVELTPSIMVDNDDCMLLAEGGKTVFFSNARQIDFSKLGHRSFPLVTCFLLPTIIMQIC